MSKLKLIYLYIFSTVGLVLVIIGSISLINLGLKTYIFTKADIVLNYPKITAPERIITDEQGNPKVIKSKIPTEEEENRQKEFEKKQLTSRRQRDASRAVAFLIVGLPIYLYHWRVVRKKDK